MVFIKQVVNADAGNADTVGGDDWDLLDSYHDDTDLSPRIANINTVTRFRDSKFRQRNPLNTAEYVTVPSAITADRNTIEPLLTGNDTRVYQAHPATLTQKTMDGGSNTFSNIPWS